MVSEQIPFSWCAEKSLLCTSLELQWNIPRTGFGPTGSWRRIPRKDRGSLQSQPPKRREDIWVLLFEFRSCWIQPREKMWNLLTQMSYASFLRRWCIYCSDKVFDSLWSVWPLELQLYSTFWINCHISWTNNWRKLKCVNFANLYWSPVVQLGRSGPFHLSHNVLQPTFENLTSELVILIVYLSGKTPPNAGVEVVFLVTVAWVWR